MLLELRTGFGQGIHTALARIEGRPVGLLASNPLHLGGAGTLREALYQRLVEQQYANGQAVNMAQTLEIDAVIDPVSAPSASAPRRPRRSGRRRRWSKG